MFTNSCAHSKQKRENTTEKAIKQNYENILLCMTFGSMRNKCRGSLYLATSGISPPHFKATRQCMSQNYYSISLCREVVVRIVGMQLMSALLQPTAKIHLCSSADAPGRRQRTLVSMTSFTPPLCTFLQQVL